MTFVDEPNKKQKHPHYEHRVEKMDKINNEFTCKQFHRIRKVSTRKTLIKSFRRIGMSINKNFPFSMIKELDKVCFIVINDYDGVKKDLGVGPLNDGYLVGLQHHRHGFKIFYLYNSNSKIFLKFLAYFLKNTQVALTIYYSGRSCNSGIEFFLDNLSNQDISDVILKNANGKAHVVFMTDCPAGGSVFDIFDKDSDHPPLIPNLTSFYVVKFSDPESKLSMRTHGIFTYYFFKFVSDDPSITPNKMIEKMQPSIKRFDEFFKIDTTEKRLVDTPIFKN